MQHEDDNIYDKKGTVMPKIEAAIVLCWKCEEPMRVVEGRTQNDVTLWMKLDQAVATPHAEGCEFKGKEMPDKPLDWIGSSSRE
jgi:hypothetical protein